MRSSGTGPDTYFDTGTADFYVNRNSGVHRQFITILIRPKDGSPAWSMGFNTAEYASALVGVRHYATETAGYSSATIGVAAAGVSCGRRVGSFIIRELRLALPAHEGFGAAIDFDARCEGATGGLYGQVRIDPTPHWDSSGCSWHVGALARRAGHTASLRGRRRFQRPARVQVHPVSDVDWRLDGDSGLQLPPGLVLDPDGWRSRRLLPADLGPGARLDERLRQLASIRTVHHQPVTGVARRADVRYDDHPIAPGTTITWTATARGDRFGSSINSSVTRAHGPAGRSSVTGAPIPSGCRRRRHWTRARTRHCRRPELGEATVRRPSRQRTLLIAAPQELLCAVHAGLLPQICQAAGRSSSTTTLVGTSRHPQATGSASLPL